MTRASALLDGVTAPIDKGFLIHEPMKRTSSLRRMPFFCSRRRRPVSILRPMRCSNSRNGRSTFSSKCCSMRRTRFSMFFPTICSKQAEPPLELL
jgi:hypothetical protein